jgi:hypothetical protein
MSFFERQKLGEIKQTKLRKKAEEELKKNREFHAKPAPGHSRSVSTFSCKCYFSCIGSSRKEEFLVSKKKKKKETFH